MMTASRMTPALTPDRVHETLGRHILADGYDMVLDIDRSHGRRLWDSRRGRRVLDMFSFFATAPVGLNHPKMADATFRAKLMRAALANPTNLTIGVIVVVGVHYLLVKAHRLRDFCTGGCAGSD